jgi:hypothetical protein
VTGCLRRHSGNLQLTIITEHLVACGYGVWLAPLRTHAHAQYPQYKPPTRVHSKQTRTIKPYLGLVDVLYYIPTQHKSAEQAREWRVWR